MPRNSGDGRGAGGGRGGTSKRPAAGRDRAAPTGGESTRGRGKGGGRNQEGIGGGGGSNNPELICRRMAQKLAVEDDEVEDWFLKA